MMLPPLPPPLYGAGREAVSPQIQPRSLLCPICSQLHQWVQEPRWPYWPPARAPIPMQPRAGTRGCREGARSRASRSSPSLTHPPKAQPAALWLRVCALGEEPPFRRRCEQARLQTPGRSGAALPSPAGALGHGSDRRSAAPAPCVPGPGLGTGDSSGTARRGEGRAAGGRPPRPGGAAQVPGEVGAAPAAGTRNRYRGGAPGVSDVGLGRGGRSSWKCERVRGAAFPGGCTPLVAPPAPLSLFSIP